MVTKKQKPGKPKKPRVKITLTPDLVSGLDQEIRRIRARYPTTKPTRGSVGQDLLRKTLMRKVETKTDRATAYKAILKEASIMKLRAMKERSLGNVFESQRFWLMAAAYELEALAVIGTQDEPTIQSTLIEVLGMLKAATGYKHLPEVPNRNVTARPDA